MLAMIPQTSVRNRLLGRLSAGDYVLIGNSLVPNAFDLSKVFAEAGQPMDDIYFPDGGVISLVIRSPEGQATEAGIVGREGFVAPSLILGAERSPYLVRAQIEGSAHRISRQALADAMHQSRTLSETLLRFVYLSSLQMSYTLLSNTIHSIDERLARWLLMCHDRLDCDDIHITHEFLSMMLSVRRSSVTTALHVLEGNGFIRSDRGYVLILDRAALEEFAEDAYGAPEAEYARAFGPLR